MDDESKLLTGILAALILTTMGCCGVNDYFERDNKAQMADVYRECIRTGGSVIERNCIHTCEVAKP